MPKLTKKQRRAKRERRKLAKSKRQSRKRTAQQRPWVAPKMRLYQLPKFLPDDMTREQRLEALRSVGARAEERFNQLYSGIAQWFRDYDAVYLLSYCAFYFLSSREGVDPELDQRRFFSPHLVEIMQAFALSEQRAATVKPLLGNAKRLFDEMREIGETMQLRLLKIPDGLVDEADLDAYGLRMEMMSHTAAIRNWAHVHQMKRVTLSLAGLVGEDFRAVYGVNSADFFRMLFALTDERESLLNDHIRLLRSSLRIRDYKRMIAAYNAAFPENIATTDSEADELWSRAGRKRMNLVGMLMSHADLKLDRIYSFTVERALSLLPGAPESSLRDLLKRLSYKFGDLRDFNKEHIILGNPVWDRPFIELEGDTYFSGIWGVMYHIALELLESLVWENAELRERYTVAKAAFLEDELESAFRSAFPHASVHRGSNWTDPVTGATFENDLTVTVDSFALVVEAKSGAVSDPAKRGAPKRLFDTLKTLIEEPSEQALRFIDFLKRHPAEHSLATRRGETNIIDSRLIRYYVPWGVTLSHLGMIGSNLKKLIDAKVVAKSLEELAPSMSFTDLEIVFSLLPLEVEKLHYFARRREFEAHMLYEGDELDLLALYLENGFNIGDTEYARDVVLNIGLKSKELDPYFIGVGAGHQVEKPILRLSTWFRDLLERISERRTEGWAETGFILLNSTQEDQEKFEKMLKQLIKRIAEGKAEKKHNWVIFSSGPERRRYYIVGYPYTTRDKSERDEMLSAIIGDEKFQNARGVVVIGVRMDRPDYPYSVMARRAATELFDVLTLK